MIYVIICGHNCEDTLQKCLESVDMQTVRDFKICLSIDGVPRKYLLKNTVDTVRGCGAGAEDILLFLDADDWLVDEDAFKIIQETYADPKVLLTYGSYCNLSDNKKGKFCGPYEVTDSFAASPWRGSHLKTMRKRLFDAIPEGRFRNEEGNWFKCCADRAMMTPAMELAGHERIKWIEAILYCYNDLNEQSCWKTMRLRSIKTREDISARPPLKELP